MEKGKRRLSAEEIMALAWALETTIPALMRPPDDLGGLRFRSGDVNHSKNRRSET